MVAGGVVAVLLCSVPLTAQADPGVDEIDQVADLVAELSPDQGTPVEADNLGTELVVTTDAAAMTAPVDPDDGLSIEYSGEVGADEALVVGLPSELNLEPAETASDGTVVYEATDEGSSAAVQMYEDGSMRVQTIIPDASAPSTYSYPVGLPEGGQIQIEEDGSAWFLNADGDLIGGAAAPWAVDGNGSEIPTRYVVDGSTLVQEVDFTEDTIFPVVADPYLGRQLIARVALRSSSQGMTVMVYPTGWGRTFGSLALAIEAYRAEYRTRVATKYETTQMYWQLTCHTQFAPTKSSWNLDSWHYRSSYASYVRNGCN